MTHSLHPGRICLGIAAGVLLSGLLLAGPLNAPVGGAAGECVELVQNGGFEAGAVSWQEYSIQGYPLISDFNPRTGQWGTYLAGVNGADDRISQQITLPADAASITLRAWWYLATAETAGMFDTMTVWLLRPDNMPLKQLAQVDNTYPVGIWDEIVADLTSYAGQTVAVQFAGQTDLSNISDFYIDDVSISACGRQAPPTFTPTLTITPTPTITRTPMVTRTPNPNTVRTFLPMIVRG